MFSLFYSLTEYFSEIIANILVKLVLICLVYILVRKLLSRRVISSDGKAVFITGCDSGFGNRLAHRLNKIGFKVYATVLSTDSPGVQELEKNAVFTDNMVVLKMNVTNHNEVKEVFMKVKSDLQKSGDVLWAVVNNAGVFPVGPLDWGSIDTFRKAFEVNVFGAVRVTRLFLPLIKASKGRIVNVVSMCGRLSLAQFGIYNMTKHSMIAFTDTLRRELYKCNVKVSSIEPGRFKTQLISNETWIKQIHDQWDESSDDVKAYYGSPQNDIEFHLRSLRFASTENNIDVAVDDMIDAVIKRWPKLVYSPMTLSLKVMYYVMYYLPTESVDFALSIMELLIRGK